MIVIPAIDIKDGKCVRLVQGDYTKVTVFSDDPVQMARHWEAQGTEWLHVVDLDGAATGQLQNGDLVRQMAQAVAVPIELGGGIRTEAAAEAALDLGVQRVILGTAALEDADLVRKVCQRWGDRIVVGVDARSGMAASHGWMHTSSTRALDLALRMQRLGVQRIIYTDIARDGMLTQPNYDAIGEMVISLDIPVIASGGVSQLEHIRRLLKIGVEGAIVGRALYTGALRYPEAKAVSEG
ncbi:MAG: 1-(5-phosphoribosyl)-5-[(5-phosphoribosylamino)methylideneamino]imidazole-4-carboxamide isomerase [Chloroflexi bacterium]|nr:1-(5-phosphoribosyl)-5-[(5-phosphoribosylamino)methylideneamino]imidazole-4-carboxamide isomerase [Chloroflexota bacterium]